MPTSELDAERILRDFGERVRARRPQAELSQADVAHAADIHPTYLSGVERGLRNVSLVNIHAIAYGLGVSVEDLFRS